MSGTRITSHIEARDRSGSVPLRIMIFVCTIMLPTIILGYLGIQTAETEKLVVWEKLKESYTSLANVASDQLGGILSSAEDDFQDSVSVLISYDKNSLQQLSSRLEGDYGVIGHVFFLNTSGEMIFPEDPRKQHGGVDTGHTASMGEGEKDTFESYLSAGERQEFKHNNPQRAIYEYQRILDDLSEPKYKAAALNSIARCYMKLGLNQEAISNYSEIIDKYTVVTYGCQHVAAIAYLRAASIYKKTGDVDAAIEMLMELYTNLSDNVWDVSAEEISYFADAARRQLLAYRDTGDARFSPFAGRFAEVDAEVGRLVNLYRFLKNYNLLMSDEMTQIADRSAGIPPGSELLMHILRYTNAGPYLVSYLLVGSGSEPDSTDNIALAGFEVDLGYLASQGFREVLNSLTVKDDIILAILDEDNEAVSSIQGAQYPGKPIAAVVSSSLPFWKVGVYLREPESLERLSKRRAGLRIFVIAGLVLAIAFGIYLTLREARREAELARLRSDFVANVSHELRTPLSSIQIFSETLKQGRAASQDKREQYLDTISSESDRLARLVDNVLNFSRLEKRSKEFDFRSTNVSEVVTSAAEAYRFYAEQRGVTMRLNIAPNLPQIQADSEAISQMLINLIDNAVKYSEDGSEISINVFRRGDKIVIRVADKGIGIDAEDMKKIFDKFYRGKNVENLGTGGTGLGLTLAKAIAEAHGGDILVRSKKGTGSRFSVILPLSRENDRN